MPATPERPEGWVRIEMPAGYAGPDAIAAYVRQHEAEIRNSLLKRATGKE